MNMYQGHVEFQDNAHTLSTLVKALRKAGVRCTLFAGTVTVRDIAQQVVDVQSIAARFPTVSMDVENGNAYFFVK